MGILSRDNAPYLIMCCLQQVFTVAAEDEVSIEQRERHAWSVKMTAGKAERSGMIEYLGLEEWTVVTQGESDHDARHHVFRVHRGDSWVTVRIPFVVILVSPEYRKKLLLELGYGS